MNALNALATRGRFELRRLLSAYPHIFLPLMRRRPAQKGNVIGAHTEIVIEGFPRSGNTFAVAAFEFAQGRPVAIARHLHAPAHVIEGIRRRLPVLVVVRDPAAAVISSVVRHPGLDMGSALRSYIFFHERLQQYRDQIVVGDFDRVTSDFGAVISAVNARFGSAFVPFDHSPRNVERVFAVVDRMEALDRTRRHSDSVATVARPDARRQGLKQEVASQLEDPRLAGRLAEAQRLYEQFTSERS